MKLKLSIPSHWLVIAQSSIIILLISFVNIVAITDSYFEFYYPHEETSHKENFFYKTSKRIIDLAPIDVLLSYTGLDTGYGFFAPNVASDFVTKFTLTDEENQIISEELLVPLENRVSITRLSSAYNNFLKYTEIDTTGFSEDICDLLLKGLALNVLKNNEEACKVDTKLFLYHYPTLIEKQIDQNASARFILVKNESFTTNDLWDHLKNSKP